MEFITTLKEYLLTVHPVRKTARQKEEFRAWLMGELKRDRWSPREEHYGKFNGSVNVIAGDPDRATVFLCAHYDTPSRMLLPDFVSPTNVAAHMGYHLLTALGLVAAAFVLSFAVSFPLNKPGLMLPLFLVLVVGLLWLSAFGPANRENANGNSSGVLALLAVARSLPRDKRVCLLFLDNNSRNLLGAAAFKRKHPNAAASALFINFDCVGDGEELLVMPSKHSRWDGELLSALTSAFRPGEGVQPHVLSQGLQYYPSDHRKFKFHVAVCACRKGMLGYTIPHLRTRRDTTLREENIRYITGAVERFLPQYFGGEQEIPVDKS